MFPESDSGAVTGGRRADVLAVLNQADEPIGVTEIADRLGIHHNTVRFHLKALVEQRRAEQVAMPAQRPGRPAIGFRSVAGMDPEGTRHYRILAEILIKELSGHRDARARALAAGRAFGRGLVADGPGSATGDSSTGVGRRSDRRSLATLVQALDDLGFQPALAGRRPDRRIELRHCPFLELAHEDARVVCAIHLGLMQGVLEQQGAAQTVGRLLPFAEPDLCRAELASGEAA
ncbi:helix-turn-helix domain-containing protein [Microlunatus elymi]|uniref:Helix-turn-helix domain-containing protein n=1 Tax=Microlunatus elymi TaxID=2596828 RepID=A0A516Q2G7_9ACTN|nr:helix-turn-helix domain-containing protein [Microlunatus elymi]QDP97401.1 helix-turn-helix domain-containing protein [Microlunatus elymi]